MSTHPQRRRRVLVIEDDPLISRLIARGLKQRHDVSLAMDGEEALERFGRGERYDLIFCDLQMPRMTGVDLLLNLDHIAPDQVELIVFLTADPDHPMARLISGNEIINKATSVSFVEIAERWLRKRYPEMEDPSGG